MLRNAIAFVVGFIVLGAVGFIGFNLFGDAMLRAAEWRPGVMPPASYVWATLATDLTGSILAGALVAWIAGKSSHKVALALVLLVSAMRAFQYVSALESNPHWYALVLIFLPAVGVPIGLLVKRRFATRGAPPDHS